MKPDPRILAFLEKIRQGTAFDIPENKRGILEASAKAFNNFVREPVTEMYEERNNGENMYYLFEIAYNYSLKCKDEPIVFYELTQVIAKNTEEAKKIIVNSYDTRDIYEIKLLKISPITSAFITYATTIPDRIYHQFDCIEKKGGFI